MQNQHQRDNQIESNQFAGILQCYQGQKQLKHKLSDPQSMIQETLPSLQSFICELCSEPIYLAVQSTCGHAFCQFCLSEYMLVSRDCPICGTKVREKKGSSNKRLDELVQEFYKQLESEDAQKFMLRKQHRKTVRQQKRVQNIYSGLEVDVRDEDYIWRKGRVIRTFNRINNEQVRVKFAIIQYTQSQKKQEFTVNCIRIAKAGFYTNRQDIPLPKSKLQLELLLRQMERIQQQKKKKKQKLNKKYKEQEQARQTDRRIEQHNNIDGDIKIDQDVEQQQQRMKRTYRKTIGNEQLQKQIEKQSEKQKNELNSPKQVQKQVQKQEQNDGEKEIQNMSRYQQNQRRQEIIQVQINKQYDLQLRGVNKIQKKEDEDENGNRDKQVRGREGEDKASQLQVGINQLENNVQALQQIVRGIGQSKQQKEGNQ